MSIKSRRLKIAVALAIASLSVFAVPISADAAGGGTILAAWTDSHGRSVFIRTGSYDAASGNGFGWVKIQARHNIHSLSSLKFVSRAPDGGVAQGYDREYTAYANKLIRASDGSERPSWVDLGLAGVVAKSLTSGQEIRWSYEPLVVSK
jgi:hypothetical protein